MQADLAIFFKFINASHTFLASTSSVWRDAAKRSRNRQRKRTSRALAGETRALSILIADKNGSLTDVTPARTIPRRSLQVH